VTFPESEVTYEFADYDQLQLAYALSIHKSQGSEYPAVILALTAGHYMMLQRNLLYTALTRARKLCIIVGDKRAIGRSVKNNKATKRYTRLAERLRGVV
jgi:exodeoxyribonuclease V alpha subunit